MSRTYESFEQTVADLLAQMLKQQKDSAEILEEIVQILKRNESGDHYSQ